MAFRFQRRVKLMPGVTVNFSKSGVGASVGPRGAKVSVGKRGVYANAGLPGTGLSYREKLNKSSGRKGASSGGFQRAGGVSLGKILEEHLLAGGTVAIQVTVTDQGEILVRDENDVLFGNDEMRVIRKLAGSGLRERVDEQCKRLNHDLNALATIHQETPSPRDTPVFEGRPFADPEPRLETLEQHTLWTKLLPSAGKKLDERNNMRRDRHAQAILAWETNSRAHREREQRRREQEAELLRGNLEAMSDLLEERLALIPWPRETSVSFDFGNDARTVALDIDLPREDDFPDIEYSLSDKQIRVSTRKVTATKRRQLYRDYAHGVAMRVLGEIFQRLPSVQVASVSAYTQGNNEGTGQEQEIYLYSALVNKERWQGINFSALDRIEPASSLDNFELRRNMTKTGVFKPINPFSLEDLDEELRNCQ